MAPEIGGLGSGGIHLQKALVQSSHDAPGGPLVAAGLHERPPWCVFWRIQIAALINGHDDVADCIEDHLANGRG